MNKKIFIASALFLIFVISLVASGRAVPKVALTILHLNDNESQLLHAGNGFEDFGGAARVVAVVKKLRSAAKTDVVLTVSAGDNFLIGPEFKASFAAFNTALGGVNTYFDARALDAIGYDAIVFGNHDFDFGPELLKDFISTGFINSSPRFLSANIDFAGEPALQALVKSGHIAKRTIIKKNGHKFGIIGATTPQLPFTSRPGNVVVDADLVAIVQKEINALFSSGVNKIIFVSHLQDIAEDKILISQLQGVDIAIAGGGSEVLANPGDLLLPGDKAGARYPVVVKDLSGRKVPIVTTGGEYKYVGRLRVNFDISSGEIISIDPDSGPVRVTGGAHPDAVKPDPEVQSLVTVPVQTYVNKLEKNIVARSEVALNGKRKQVRSKETNIGNLVADALLSEAQRLSRSHGIKAPVIALTNGGGIRNNTIIAAGQISERDTYDIAPFANFLTVFESLTVKTLKNLLENAVSRIDNQGNPAGSGTGRFAQVAGFSFEYDSSRSAAKIAHDGRIVNPGKRITRVILDDKTKLIEDGNIVADPSYTLALATTDFLARGGDQYPFGASPFINLFITYQEALSNYIRLDLRGVITAVDYPEGGSGRIARR